MKKVLAIVLTAILITCAAASAQTALRAKAEYEGFGFVELELSRDVRWTSPEITVSDAYGNTYTAEVFKYDSDDVDFLVADLPEDQAYTVTVSGIRDGSTASCEFFAAARMSTMIHSVEYDHDDRELEIDFAMDVTYSDPAVTVTDAAGNVYECRIVERDEDSLEVVVKGLARGGNYTVNVSGVQGRGLSAPEFFATGDTGTFSREFTALDD